MYYELRFSIANEFARTTFLSQLVESRNAEVKMREIFVEMDYFSGEW